ncbi:universal stress protein [Paraburkholderia sp. J8-2]|uniref:universal stress protein n=1 Tax=Paraburkholderia sp. J8-2 TaxID=2805440 RepID=UPI002AB69366|nr:universal stress protein [Paraburkholderia sp. J8-2]
MYEKILVAFDGSETSKLALDEALRMAQLTGARLCVAHVIDAVAPFGMGLTYVPVELLASYREEAKARLEAARSEAKAAGVDCETQMQDVGSVTQSVADSLQACASRFGAQLVVLGTHGRRGVRRAFLGSVAEEFVRNAPCPVLLVRGGPA